MKRRVISLFLIGLLIIGLSEISFAEPQQTSVAQVTTEKGPLNMRKSPDSKAGVMERIPNRSLVLVVSQGDDFWEVTYENQTGYAMCQYLVMTDYTPDVLNYKVLYRNNQGDDVITLKQQLCLLGYYREGSNMNNNYNETCIERVKMFQRQNGLNEDGIATPEMQAVLYSSNAIANAEALPAPKSNSYFIADTSSTSSSDDVDWAQWMLDNPGVCPCCMGKGCGCCGGTGHI